MLVTGFTADEEFPVSGSPAQEEHGRNTDAFVLLLSANGSDLLYSTYVGGRGADVGYAVASDSGGRAWVTGETGPPGDDFPTEGAAFRTARTGIDADAFVLALSPRGDRIEYSTLFGGSEQDRGFAVAVQGDLAYVVGETQSTDISGVGPLPGGQSRLGGSSSSGDWWLIPGILEDSGLEIGPVHGIETTGPEGEGEGTHRLEVRGAADEVLAVRRFTPREAGAESLDDDPEPLSFFAQLVPRVEGAESFVVIDDEETTLARVERSGLPPEVTVLFPAGGEELEGEVRIEWSASDPDGDPLLCWLLYSPDDGKTWSTLARGVRDTVLDIDFDGLPGSDSAPATPTVTAGSPGRSEMPSIS